MQPKLKPEFHSELAQSMLNEIQFQRSNYYFFLGKSEPWTGEDSADSLPRPNTYDDINSIRSNMIYMKRIASNDVTLVIPNYQWESKVFAQWDPTLDMTGVQFYCVTDENSVYKCLNNNQGATSTVKPTGRGSNFGPISTADGYLWKYMYTVPSFKKNKFVTLNYVPVQKALSDSFYNKGSAEEVIVTSPGSGYIDQSLTSIIVNGTCTVPCVAVPVITKTDQTILNDDETINFFRPKGTILRVKIINPGEGYTVAPTVTINDPLGTGTGIYGTNAEAVFQAHIHDGKVTSISVVDPGVGYTVDNDTVITVQGDGRNAVFTPIVYNGSVVDVVTENVGTGYNYMLLSVVGAGTGATVYPVLGSSDFISDQSTVEQTAVGGAIYSVVISNQGSGYTQETTTVSITGNGTIPCTAVAVVSPSGNITKINITNAGAGFTFANVTVTDSVSASSNCVARAIIAPLLGHGKDAPSELNANTLAINSFLSKDVILNKLSRDYRQYGLIKNPLVSITNQTFREDSAMAVFEVYLDGAGNNINDLVTNSMRYVQEDILYEAGTDYLITGFRIISITADNKVLLQPIGNKYDIPSGELRCLRNGLTYTIIELLSVPIVNKYSGKLLYIADENPFSFDQDQGISIKTFLEF